MAASPDLSVLANSLVVGVTGHRHLRGQDIAGLEAGVRTFLQELQARFHGLPLVVLSPMAEGADQLVAQVALALGLHVVAPLPLPLALYREDFEDPASLQMLERQLHQVEVMELPLERGETVASLALPGPTRDRRYRQAGIFVSSHGHVLLALWDGQPSGRVGGTADIVRFHLEGATPADPDNRRATDTLLGPDQENVVHHLPAARRGAADLADARPRWLVAGEGAQAGSSLPDAFARMFSRQAAFNVDLRRYAAPIVAEPAPSPAAAACPVWRTFAGADWLARLYQRRVARVLSATYVLVALMGFAFFTYTDIVSDDLVIYLFLLLFAAGTVLMLIASRREWQRKYLDYRALAEGLRVQSYWRRAGIVVAGTRAFAHDNFMQKQDVELGWIRNVMRGAGIDGMRVPVTADAAQVQSVVAEWIGEPGGDGQLGYYAGSSLRRARLHRRAELLGLACIGLGVALCVLLAIFASRLDAQTKQVLVSVMGILSVAAAVHEAYMHKKADKELIRQYRFMQRIFASAHRRLAAVVDVVARQRILAALGEAALTEHAEWTLLHRERPLPQSRI
ncbi:hypothetical protein H5368_01375 [Luteimonas sp. MC1782]|uniref:hypothetical protein n=1 Tax=Luteimonas sp. MC1782 TaxID=2760305 RepID=UPI0015FF4422|nr:hypothetical protein [Luteimonas sp. MC1782]MBB1471676.1 hypothetical protein [Luteimonas sp. MC1782]